MAFENLTPQYLHTVMRDMKEKNYTLAETAEDIPEYFFASDPAHKVFFVFNGRPKGRGTFGQVHQGYYINPLTGQIHTGYAVALKKLEKTETAQVDFEIEKTALQKDKDLIISGENHENYFLVMKYVEGVNLGYYKYDDERNLVMHLTPSLNDLPFEERIKAIWLLILDLDNLHSLKKSGPAILHRDIKPWNILVATESKEKDGRPVKTVKSVRLVDYGLVHLLTEQDEEALSDAEKPDQEKFLALPMHGTPGFTAPETQNHQINFRSEYYPLVAIIWLLLGAVDPLKDTKGLSAAFRVALKYNSDGLFENIGPVPEELKKIIFDFTKIMASHNFSDRPEGQNLLMFFTAVHRYCINKNIEDLEKLYSIVYGHEADWHQKFEEFIAEMARQGDADRTKSVGAEIYLYPLYQAEKLISEQQPGSDAQRDEFLAKLLAYKKLFKTELAKELAKGEKADQTKINDAKEIALEYYEMTRTLCDPQCTEEDQQAAIDKAYNRSTKNFWWNLFGLKLLKIAFLAAAAAFVGFVIGYAVGNFVGGTIFGYKFATAATSAYVGGMFGASTLGKVGSSIGTFRFFYTPLEKKSKEFKNAAKDIKAEIDSNPLLAGDVPMAVVEPTR